jgi:hypothetical protein
MFGTTLLISLAVMAIGSGSLDPLSIDLVSGGLLLRAEACTGGVDVCVLDIECFGETDTSWPFEVSTAPSDSTSGSMSIEPEATITAVGATTWLVEMEVEFSGEYGGRRMRRGD